MIHVEDRPHIRQLIIDRPERRNAVDHATLHALLAGVTGAPTDTRVLVLSGAGGHFCAGADLSGVEDRAFVDLLNEVLVALGTATFPTLAAIEGAALGAGTQLAAACDLRCAAPDATFGIPAAKLGLMVDQWTVHRLCELAGQGPARAMLLAAETYTGEQAFGFGFVQRQGGVDDGVAWAEHIATLAPLTIAGHKVGCNEAEPAHTPSVAYGEAFARAWASDDLQEGLASFRERRRAEFGGR